jgi:hypothetical protein
MTTKQRYLKYKIVRMFQEDGKPSITIKRGLTLAQARAHCSRKDTKGVGWFDGYDLDIKSQN